MPFCVKWVWKISTKEDIILQVFVASPSSYIHWAIKMPYCTILEVPCFGHAFFTHFSKLIHWNFTQYESQIHKSFLFCISNLSGTQNTQNGQSFGTNLRKKWEISGRRIKCHKIQELRKKSHFPNFGYRTFSPHQKVPSNICFILINAG